jgi:hypothetical protein
MTFRHVADGKALLARLTGQAGRQLLPFLVFLVLGESSPVYAASPDSSASDLPSASRLETRRFPIMFVWRGRYMWKEAQPLEEKFASDCKNAFERKGISFPTGTSVRFHFPASLLIITHTPETLDRIGAILRKAYRHPPGIAVDVRVLVDVGNDAKDDLEAVADSAVVELTDQLRRRILGLERNGLLKEAARLGAIHAVTTQGSLKVTGENAGLNAKEPSGWSLTCQTPDQDYHGTIDTSLSLDSIGGEDVQRLRTHIQVTERKKAYLARLSPKADDGDKGNRYYAVITCSKSD